MKCLNSCGTTTKKTTRYLEWEQFCSQQCRKEYRFRIGSNGYTERPMAYYEEVEGLKERACKGDVLAQLDLRLRHDTTHAFDKVRRIEIRW